MEDNKQELASVCKRLEETSKHLVIPATNDELVRQFQDISEKFDILNSKIVATENVEMVLSRLENTLLLLKKGEQETEKSEIVHEPSDFELLFPEIARFKDEISYTIITCFSVYFVYKLFFP